MRRLILLSLLLPWPALAHSELRGSVPAPGARLAAPPEEILLRFNERVQVTALRLRDASGRTIALRRQAGAEPAQEARATPEAPLPPGDFVLEWRAISADGHPIRGAIRFTVTP
ncbi:copper resistance CopC family protein [Rubritepida flocculans]|uniref:copper resistance CopC family protein n=1 Tax=Rubritepida flocculans TaxID=182403 RepID=UPI0003F9A420|nr:copper resistance CopC family protein [Rubritepida flocculans]